MPAAGWIPAGGPDLWGTLGGPGTHSPKAHADVRISNMSLILRSSELVGDTGRHPDRMIEHVAAMLSQALDELTRQGTTVPGIVLAQPGIIDYANDTVRYSSTLGRYDVALVDKVRDAIARRTGSGRDVPVITLENDAKLAALATYERYARDGVRNLLYLSGGEGIGAGIISDGHLLRGWLGLTGEVGHMPVEPEGLACRCGRRGCWETRSGLQALTSIYPPGDAVRDETTSLDERIELLRQRFDAGDAELAHRLELSQRALARALAILTDVLNPEVIVLSGYLAAFADVFISPTASALKDRLLDQRAAVRLETSHLGQWASSHGAALVALESVLDNPTLVDLRPTS